MKHDEEQSPPSYEDVVGQSSQQNSLALSTAQLEHQAALERLEHERLLRQADLERIAYEREARPGSGNHGLHSKNDTLEAGHKPTSDLHPWRPTLHQILKAIHRVPTSKQGLKDDYGQLTPNDAELSLPPFDAEVHQLCKRPEYQNSTKGLSKQAFELRAFLILRLEQDYAMGRGVQDPHWKDLATLVRDSKLAFATRSLSGEKLLEMSATLQAEVWQPAAELGLLTEEVEESLLAHRKWGRSGCVHAVALQNGVETVAAKLCYDWYKVRQLLEPGQRREKVLEGIRDVAGRYLGEGHYWWRVVREEVGGSKW